MNSTKLQFWLILVLSTALTGWLVFSQRKPQKRRDIIKFSHAFHQVEVGTSCTDCHTKANESTLSGDNLLPKKEDCAECHDVETEEECTFCHYEDEETWQAFENPERDILFNHKFHLEETGLDCETCHKNLAKVDFSNSESRPNMADCSACHNNQRATLECSICHTSTLNLRPVDHSADFLMTHKNIARIDQEDCAVCHAQNDCAECHEGASLIGAKSGSKVDILSPLFPSMGNGTRGLLLTRVHEPNFRTTHPLKAVGRTQECVVCHESRNFCQTCHEAEGVDVAGKPIWHGGLDWGALAGVVGTGGGRHAELAKRDIETCAACHSTQGDDPTCLLCHTDFDGLRGTNPKTHEIGYRNQFGEDSDFHNDEAALCYSCHTNTQQSGVGFCGYCHGPK